VGVGGFSTLTLVQFELGYNVTWLSSCLLVADCWLLVALCRSFKRMPAPFVSIASVTSMLWVRLTSPFILGSSEQYLTCTTSAGDCFHILGRSLTHAAGHYPPVDAAYAFGAMMNSFVHVLMYGHYAAAGDSYTP
jgi:hypothetical protein